MKMLTPKPIKTQTDYKTALQFVSHLMDKPRLNPAEGDLLEVWAVLIEQYESEHYAMPKADPIEVIKFVIEQQSLKQKDLTPYFGAATRVSEVLAGKRKLTVGMIAKLHKGLKIPLEALIAG